MSIAASDRPLCALVLAPRGRDAAIAGSLIDEAGVTSRACRDLATLVGALDDDTAFVLITEEAIRTADLRPLVAWLADQPAWSDLPVVLLTDHGGGPERNPIAGRWLEALGNVSFIERPFHPTTLVSLVRATVKGRRRQLQTRALLEDLRQGEVRLQQRVEERTAELQRTHDELLVQAAERARVEEQVRQLQKLESIGQLTGGVAHDFNNLLTVVLGNLDLLRKRLPADPAIDRLIDGAIQGAQRGAALTQRLLTFARRQALEAKPTDLAELVRGMDDLLRRSIGPSVAIVLDLPAGLPSALADHNQIELALLNLAVNARDAMPEGGTLTVSLSQERVPAGDSLAAGTYLRLCVSDSGGGMDAETLSRAIEPFFSTKDVGKGTGLGLSMIHGLALQLKGSLRLYSEPGRGTRAELCLTLLFVDDDTLISLSTVALLEDLGHEVIEAASGQEALDVLESGTPVDLMITDYAMPGMTGLQLAEAARKLRPALPILLATGYAELPARTKLVLPRLAKPYQQKQLAERITALVG